MTNQEKNTPAQKPIGVYEFDGSIYEAPTILEEFFELRKDKQLLRGLNVMFQTFFAKNRYFDDEDNNEAVMEAYHFCHFVLTHKEVFNHQNLAS